jgi:hypothetical protein
VRLHTNALASASCFFSSTCFPTGTGTYGTSQPSLHTAHGCGQALECMVNGSAVLASHVGELCARQRMYWRESLTSLKIITHCMLLSLLAKVGWRSLISIAPRPHCHPW